MPSITIRSGLLAGRTFPIDRATVIGRGATADLSLADPGVSRRHARISRGPDGWVVEDLGSAANSVAKFEEASAVQSGESIDLAIALASIVLPTPGTSSINR